MTETPTHDTDPATTKRYIVGVEKIHDPQHNWTIIGGPVEIDPTEFESDRAAREHAAKQAWDRASETPDDVVGDFKVYEIAGDSLVTADTVIGQEVANR